MKKIFTIVLLMVLSGCLVNRGTDTEIPTMTQETIQLSLTYTLIPTSTTTPMPTNTAIPTEFPLPSLMQVNEDGFGVLPPPQLLVLESFDGGLFAGAFGLFDRSTFMFRYDSEWEDVTPKGVFSNSGVNDFHVFRENLYLGTLTYNPPAEIWRSSDGLVWERIYLHADGVKINCYEVSVFFEIDGYLYAAFGDDEEGAEIWRSETGDSYSWTKVTENGLGKSDNTLVYSAVKYQGSIILGTISDIQARLYQSNNGTDWLLLHEFDQDPPITQITSLIVFREYLYITVRYEPGDISAKVMRCQTCDGTDWEIVFEQEHENIGYVRKPTLIEFNSHLFYIVGNDTQRDGIAENNGLEIWRSRNGVDWIRIAESGIDDINNTIHYWKNAIAIHDGKLYLGTINFETGGEVWEIYY